MEIVFISRHQNTTLVNDLKESLVVEGFMELKGRGRPSYQQAQRGGGQTLKSDMRNGESISSYYGNLGEFVDLYFKSALISAFSTPALTLGP